MMGSQEGESVAVTVSSIKPRDKAGSSEVILNPAEEERRRARAFSCEGHRRVKWALGVRQAKRQPKSQWRSIAGRGKKQVKG